MQNKYNQRYSSVHVIDPLELKIHQLLTEGYPAALYSALNQFVLEDDIETLLINLRNVQLDSRKHIFLDFTPFVRPGRFKELIEKLGQENGFFPILMIQEDTFQYLNYTNNEDLKIPVALFSSDGNLIKIEMGSKRKNDLFKDIEKDLNLQIESSIPSKATTFKNFRRFISNQNLSQILFDPNCIELPTNSDKKSKYLAGHFYKKMDNKMLASCYINLKRLGQDIQAITKVAYYVIQELADYFRRDQPFFSDFDVIVTPNNTALFLGSPIQMITNLQVIPIDKMGPIPIMINQKEHLKKVLENKRIILFTEVIATGGEVDRTLLFLNELDIEVERVLAIYNLEIGKPLLISPDRVISLCYPKEELSYVYRSE